MNVQTKRMDIISNDLANANTTEYKRDTAVVSSFSEILTTRIKDMQNHVPNDANIGTMIFGIKVDGTYTQFVQGFVVITGNPTNMAIQGNFLAYLHQMELKIREMVVFLLTNKEI